MSKAETIALIKAFGGSGGSNSGGTQPDWNQSDETAPDYVKNRTHWVEVTRSVKLECKTDLTDVTHIDKPATICIALARRNELAVVFDDVLYKPSDLVLREEEVDGVTQYNVEVGDVASIELSVVLFDITVADYSVQHNVVFEKYKETVHPLDKKFIPDTIARVEDIPEDKGRIFGAINFSNVLSMPKTQFINTNGNWYLQSIEWVDTKNQFYIGSRNLAEFEVGVTEALIGVYDSNFNFIKSTKVNAGHINDMAFCSSNNKLYIPTADKGLYTKSIVTINIDTLEIENIYPFDRPCYQLSYDKKNNQLIGSFGGLLRWMDLDCNILKELTFDIPDYLEELYTFQSTFIVDERLFFVGCGNNDARTIIIYEINTKTGEMIYCDTGNIGTQEVEAVTVKGEELYLLSGQYLTRIHKMPFHQFAQNSLLALDNAGELLAEGANLNNYASRVGKYRASGGASAATMLNIPTSYRSADGGFSIWVELVAQDCFKNVLVSKSGRIFFRIWTVENGCGAWKEIQMQ